MKDIKPIVIIENPWERLKQYTQARIAIGRCGSSIPTDEMLQFKLAHAKAIDAVHLPLDKETIAQEIEKNFGIPVLRLHSAAKDRSEYLRRPDLGRILSDESIATIQKTPIAKSYDVAIVIADGLSSTAIDRNIKPFLNQFIPMLQKKNFSIAPLSMVEQGRVAVADSIAELLNAKLTVILIGERPGLKSPDSLGIYMTYNPKKGTTDERRNCISNVRQGGLSYPVACAKLFYLIEESFKRQLSGVELKDDQSQEELMKNAEMYQALIVNSTE